MLFFVAAYYIIFKYVPIYGLQIAFKDYTYQGGITGSEFNNFENFKYIFSEADFWSAFKNTLEISMLKIVIGFPIPIVLAIMINEMVFRKTKRVFQVIYTFPHFLSWVIMSSMIFSLLSSDGVVNGILYTLGFDKINFLTNVSTFRSMLVFTEVWKESGWSTIIYIATITGIDASLYEAAEIDGANRWQRILNIQIPLLIPMIVTMFILRIGHIMSAGYLQVLNLYNPVVYSVGDILDTYIYRITFLSTPDFGVSTAVGLFTGTINFAMLCLANWVSKICGQKGVL